MKFSSNLEYARVKLFSRVCECCGDMQQRLKYEGRLKSSWSHYSESELCGGAVTVSF
jgi:hypothetical protein